MTVERLQKILAHAGVASRRAAEELIQAGRVRVNGRIVRELGVKADARKDKVELDGRRLVAEKPVYYLLNKPREMVTTLSDPEGRACLSDVLGRIPERVYPVGRLDYHTSGALLVTNDGHMADALLHPTRSVPKTYVAKVKGSPQEAALKNLRQGVTLDDGYKTQPAEVFVVNEERGNCWLQITIKEGKNRQVHRMGDAVGHPVMRLSRTVFAGLKVDGLRPGQMRPISGNELDKLKRDYLNPRKRDKFNQQRNQTALQNAGLLEEDDGWGEALENEPPGPPARGARGGRSGAGRNAPARTPRKAAGLPAKKAAGSRTRPRDEDERPASRPGRKKAAGRSRREEETTSPRGGARKKTATRARRGEESSPSARGGRKPAARTRATEETAGGGRGGRKPVGRTRRTDESESSPARPTRKKTARTGSSPAGGSAKARATSAPKKASKKKVGGRAGAKKTAATRTATGTRTATTRGTASKTRAGGTKTRGAVTKKRGAATKKKTARGAATAKRAASKPTRGKNRAR